MSFSHTTEGAEMLTEKNAAAARRALIAAETARIRAERRAAEATCKSAEFRAVEGR